MLVFVLCAVCQFHSVSWYLTAVLILISPMSDEEYFFFSRTYWLSFWRMCLFISSLHIFDGAVLFFILSLTSAICIMDTYLLFSPFFGVSFYSSKRFFVDVIPFVNFFPLYLANGFESLQMPLGSVSWRVLPVFSSFQTLFDMCAKALIKVSLSLWNLTNLYCAHHIHWWSKWNLQGQTSYEPYSGLDGN